MQNAQISKDKLQHYVDRLEELERNIKTMRDDIKYIFKDAQNSGFDIKAIKRVMLIKKRDKRILEEEEAMVALYAEILGL